MQNFRSVPWRGAGLTLLLLLPGSLLAGEAPPNALEVLLHKQPSVVRLLTPSEREALRSLTLAQAQAYADGTAASEIVLADGRTLAELLVLKGLGFSIQWSTVDGGGGLSSGGSYSMTASVGQPDSGVLTGGDYRLHGGFLVGEPVPPLFCDGFETGDTNGWSSCAGCI